MAPMPGVRGTRVVVRALTLIELLIVIAIVSLVLALMLPALGAARRQGKIAVCLSHLRQLGQQTHLFVAEHLGSMPRSRHSAGLGFARGEPWEYAFAHQITGGPLREPQDEWWRLANGLYRCPFDRRHSPVMLQGHPRSVFSYGYNVYFELTEQETAVPPDTSGPTWRRIEQIPHPSDCVLFGELKVESGPMVDHAMAHFWTLYDVPPEIDAQRHEPLAGYAWVDGHATQQSFETTFAPSEGVNRWNPQTAR